MSRLTSQVYHRQFAKRQQQQRKMDDFRDDLRAKVKQDMIFFEGFKSEAKVGQKIQRREIAEAETLEAAERARIAQEKLKEDRERLHKATDLLSQKIASQMGESIREDKTRQRFREQDEQLKRLKARLDQAYVQKARESQIDGNNKAKQEERERIRLEDERTLVEMGKSWAVDDEREKQKKEMQVEGKKIIEKQLQEKEQAKQAAYEEFLREKAIIDEIATKLQEEEAQAERERMEKQKEEWQFVTKYLEESVEWKKKQKQMMAEENAKIEAHRQTMQDREDKHRAEVAASRVRQTKALEQVAQSIKDREADKLKLEEIRMELNMEEAEARRREAEKKKVEHRIRQRMDIIKGNAEIAAVKKQKQAEEAAVEDGYRQAMMDKFAADDKLEQLSAEKRRRKMAEHRREVDQLIQDRANAKTSQKKQLQDEYEEEKRNRELHLQIIEDERRKMLQEHAANLIGYLPKGFFKEGDLDGMDDVAEKIDEKWKERKEKYKTILDDESDDEDLDAMIREEGKAGYQGRPSDNRFY